MHPWRILDFYSLVAPWVAGSWGLSIESMPDGREHSSLILPSHSSVLVIMGFTSQDSPPFFLEQQHLPQQPQTSEMQK